MFKKRQEGQVLLIVVLTMVVALTVGLSIASRVVTQLKLSKQNEESQRAFQAAEAGIEQALTKGQSIATTPLGNNSSFTTSLTPEDGSIIALNAGLQVDQDSGADVWLSDYPTYANSISGNVTVYWGDPSQTSCGGTGENVAPALEISILSGTTSSPQLSRYVFEANSCSRIAGAVKATGPATDSNGNQYANSANISISNGLVMKIIPLLNSSVVELATTTSGVSFPSQGSAITSTGTSGDTVRKVTYFQSYPQLPLEFFPYSILSQ